MQLIATERRPEGGLLKTFVDDDGNVTEQYLADVEPVIDLNKKAMNGDAPRHLLAGGDFNGELIARIPVDVALLWKQRFGIDVYDAGHDARVMQLLNDPDWRYLKTTWKTL
jgi:hypothetical protein